METCFQVRHLRHPVACRSQSRGEGSRMCEEDPGLWPGDRSRAVLWLTSCMTWYQECNVSGTRLCHTHEGFDQVSSSFNLRGLFPDHGGKCHPDVTEKDLDWNLVALRPWGASKTHQGLTFNLGAERCIKPREERKLALANLSIEFLGLWWPGT